MNANLPSNLMSHPELNECVTLDTWMEKARQMKSNPFLTFFLFWKLMKAQPFLQNSLFNNNKRQWSGTFLMNLNFLLVQAKSNILILIRWKCIWLLAVGKRNKGGLQSCKTKKVHHTTLICFEVSPFAAPIPNCHRFRNIIYFTIRHRFNTAAEFEVIIIIMHVL